MYEDKNVRDQNIFLQIFEIVEIIAILTFEYSSSKPNKNDPIIFFSKINSFFIIFESCASNCSSFETNVIFWNASNNKFWLISFKSPKIVQAFVLTLKETSLIKIQLFENITSTNCWFLKIKFGFKFEIKLVWKKF